MTSNLQNDVVLVRMPYAPLECPSLGLGMLQAQLTRAGISSEVIYADLLFAEEIGLHTYQMISYSTRQNLLGEWTFAGSAFPGFNPESSTLVTMAAKQFCHNAGVAMDAHNVNTVAEAVRHVRLSTNHFINRLAEAILQKNPAVVGCSSMFQQQVASMALLRRVKELKPEVVTLMGGANCEGEMGARLVLEFPWIDIAFSGEADGVAHELCRVLIRYGRNFPVLELPPGALSRLQVQTLKEKGARSTEFPRNVVERLDELPMPDYDAYFAALERSSYKDTIRPGLLLETSRGCWWGEKRQCSFCGLNGKGLKYRAKSPERVLEEFDEVSKRYGISDITLTDCVMSKEFFQTIFPELVKRGSPYRLFYEARSNMGRKELELLANAGVRWIQPGVEALHDGLLKLMNKGVRAADNVQLLKYARRFGIRLQWNLLVGIPGEDDQWHRDTATLLPLLYHLEPMRSVWFVRFDRFSSYHRNPAKYGLKLAPMDAYRIVYPVSEEALNELAYYFYDRSQGPVQTLPPGIKALVRQIRQWDAVHSHSEPPSLTMEDKGNQIVIHDTRPCALQKEFILKGLSAAIYRACQDVIRSKAVAEKVKQDASLGEVGDEKIQRTLQRLKKMKLLVELGGYCISLALPGNIPAMEPWEHAPYGFAPVLDFYGVVNENAMRGDKKDVPCIHSMPSVS